MKRILSLILIIVLSLSCSAVSADNSIIISLQIDNPIMTVNGVEKEIDPGYGTSPLISGDRTLVPIRAVIESMGGSVGWDDITDTVSLTIGENNIKLGIGSNVAYCNSTPCILDTVPVIINSRTMLPIRFIAEKFNFSVGWDDYSRTVTIKGIYTDNSSKTFSPYDIPPYNGSPYCIINNNLPFFKEDEITSVSFEYYSELDYLGRCGVCIASIGRDIMPTGERESIGSVKPTGWHSVKYDNVDGKYLYNRCHLIGYQLSSENANKKNLITGTRYMNTEGMLPFENKVAEYVESTGNHVMYRVTPIFENDNLLAKGVLMEAYSVEDNGYGIKFCVFCYNIQPGININYSDGSSSYGSNIISYSPSPSSLYILNTGTKKFHYPTCSSVSKMNEENKSYSNDTRETIIILGFIPCGICKP